MITLTADERRKFSLWLRQDADSNQQLIEQMENLPHLAAVIEFKKREIAAAIIVAVGLDATEELTLGS